MFEPLAQPMKHLTQNVVAPGGVWSGVIPFAIDEDAIGSTIRFTDVATGAQVEHVIMLLGDLDDDGDVDLDDYVLFEDALDGPGVAPSNPEADLDGDGDCDLADWSVFAENFGL